MLSPLCENIPLLATRAAEVTNSWPGPRATDRWPSLLRGTRLDRQVLELRSVAMLRVVPPRAIKSTVDI
jgi:hypothetical protein